MIRQPRPGQRVELHYGAPRRKGAPSMRAYTGLHLARGTVVTSGGGFRRGELSWAWEDEHHHGTERNRGERKGSPINALVEIEGGRLLVVPRGQLFPGGAVDLDACPDGPPRRVSSMPCRCGACAECGSPKHSAIHGPVFGEGPGTKPWGHEFKEG